ncbi:MAG: hypothetical protein IJL87_04315 [Clostridia bacterium]|nr:hypothetical protein [Clostridia bacterium]
MKTVKINFAGFWGSFKKDDNLFVRLLRKHFNVEISDNPDFVICSNRGEPFEYMKYDCVRIMFMGENMSPDFTVFDYCIGFDFLQFGDRYMRMPFAFYFNDGIFDVFERLSREQAKQILKNKKYFCNFIYGHQSSHGMREKLFYKLGEYKPVISPGSHLNNMGGGEKRCSWKEKKDFVRASKFTIAGDSINYPGFVTEKIVDPFICRSIPIYFGSTRIDEDFNTDAFIWCRSESELDKTLERVKYLDTHDDAYIDMLMQSPLLYENQLADLYENLEKFLVNIFSQQPRDAIRRVRFFAAEKHENQLREYMRRCEKTPEFVKKIKSFIK